MISPNGNKLAAVVAPKCGKWTVAVDGNPWSATFGDLVTDAVFSPDGNRLAALANNDGKWMIVLDGAIWKNTFEMAWQPVFSPGTAEVAVNGQLWDQECDAIWDPVFSPDGDKILLRTIQDGNYTRRVISVAEILR